jgi:hypothetical protein
LIVQRRMAGKKNTKVKSGLSNLKENVGMERIQPLAKLKRRPLIDLVVGAEKRQEEHSNLYQQYTQGQTLQQLYRPSVKG